MGPPSRCFKLPDQLSGGVLLKPRVMIPFPSDQAQIYTSVHLTSRAEMTCLYLGPQLDANLRGNTFRVTSRYLAPVQLGQMHIALNWTWR
jgi:hypothetical protein